jgi:nicotinamidase-related amidase
MEPPWTECASGASGKTALVMIDMSIEQVEALHFRKEKVVGTIRALLEGCKDRAASRVIDLVIDARLWISDPRQTTLWRVYPNVGHAGTPGAVLLPELSAAWKVIPDNLKEFSAKLNYSAFYATNLDDILRAHGVLRLLLCGINTDFCIFASALDAFYRGYDVRIVEDAVSTVAGERAHVDALDRARAHFGASVVISASDVLGRSKAMT